ncbi:hypothetical protein EMIT0P74_100162 [Pseudomonas sp. IT-P74]
MLRHHMYKFTEYMSQWTKTKNSHPQQHSDITKHLYNPCTTTKNEVPDSNHDIGHLLTLT